jgi:hypothetical protein
VKIKIDRDYETGIYFEGYGWELELPDALIEEWRALEKRLFTEIYDIFDKAIGAASWHGARPND